MVGDHLIHQRLNGNPTGFQSDLGRFLEPVSEIEKSRTSKRNFPTYLGGRGVSKVARSWWRARNFFKFSQKTLKRSTHLVTGACIGISLFQRCLILHQSQLLNMDVFCLLCLQSYCIESSTTKLVLLVNRSSYHPFQYFDNISILIGIFFFSGHRIHDLIFFFVIIMFFSPFRIFMRQFY